MVFTSTIVGAVGDDTIVRGNVKLVAGTWSAGGDSNGVIVTGGSQVIAYGITNTENNSEMPRTKKNVNGSGTAAAGSIGFLSFTDNTNNTGEWWAIIRN